MPGGEARSGGSKCRRTRCGPTVKGAVLESSIRFNEVDWLATARESSTKQLGCHLGIICPVTVIEEKSGMGESKFVGRCLGVSPGHPEGTGSMAGVGRRHSYSGDSLNV